MYVLYINIINRHNVQSHSNTLQKTLIQAWKWSLVDSATFAKRANPAGMTGRVGLPQICESGRWTNGMNEWSYETHIGICKRAKIFSQT